MSAEAVKYPEWVQTESEKKLHDDFRAFLWLLWRHLRLPNPTRRQIAIARYLQHGPKRRMIQAFRGVGKTWLTCAYALWRLYRNPNERVKIVSANEDKAVENASFMRRLIDEVPQLQFLRPRGGMRDSVLAFDVGPALASVTPSVSCVGITGQLTGGRATILISDDVEVPKNSYTEIMRERLAEQVKEYDALVVPEGFDIIYLGTPQTEQSIYNLVRSRGYDCRIWPARYPAYDQQVKYGGALAEDILADLGLAPDLVGKSTDPERFSDLDLMEREASYGRSGFALQFQLDTSLSDAERYPLKLADLIVHDVDASVGHVKLTWASGPAQVVKELANPGFAGDRFHRPLYISPDVKPWEGTLLYIDPSGRGADETAYVVLRALAGMLYLVAVGGFRSGYGDETLRSLAEVAKEHRVNLIKIEPNFGDGLFQKVFEPWLLREDPETRKPFYACTVEEAERAVTQKEKRLIATLEPVMNQHRLVVDPKVIKADIEAEDPKYSLFYQLTHITKEKGALRHDDRLDALAGGVQHFIDSLARDTQKAEQQHREELRDAEYRKFMAAAGHPQQQVGFISRCSVLGHQATSGPRGRLA
jgi:hypothetical protein